MSIDTRAVKGRRKLSFTSLNETVADAEKLVNSANARVLGNWPLTQLLAHLAKTVDSSIDGISDTAPWFVRLIGPFFKHRVLTKGVPAGKQLPRNLVPKFFPETPTTHEALEKMRAAVSRTRTEKMTTTHPVFGKMTHEEWLRFHLRHAELHLSFALPS